jgi:hypothetical protein
MSWNCEAMTPTRMVKRTATEACNAPKKGISSSWVAWPIVGVWKGQTRRVTVSERPGCMQGTRESIEVGGKREMGWCNSDRGDKRTSASFMEVK